MREIFLDKTFPHNVPMDMWNAVLKQLVEIFRQKNEGFSLKFAIDQKFLQ